MSGRKSNKQKVEDLFKPYRNGKSKWISVEDIKNSDLTWTKNGNARHGVFFGVSEYKWERKTVKGKITKLRLVGLNKEKFDSHKRPISKTIKEFYKKQSCVVCGSNSGLVCDHKNDLYNDPRVLDIKTQKLDDFQSLCTHCNLQKRQVAKKTRETNKRYGATQIPSVSAFGVNFTKGGEKFDPKDPMAMVGTYWYDPVDFVKKAMKMKKGKI